MKNLMIKFGITLGILTLCFVGVLAQNAPDALTPDAEANAGLDLYAVAETFKDAETLEKFEQSLNNAETGINNLDLNEDNQVDFIRVTETVADKTHLIILQTALGEDDFQDVATIAVEQENGANYNLQLQGDPTIYGENYYVVPANDNFSGWSVVRWLFRPNYRPYVSPFGYRTHPRWWNVRRPVAFSVYRNRAGLFGGRRNFTATKTVRVKTIAKLNYRPRASVLVTRRTRVTRTTTTTNARNGNQTTTTRRTNPRAGKPRKGRQ